MYQTAPMPKYDGRHDHRDVIDAFIGPLRLRERRVSRQLPSEQLALRVVARGGRKRDVSSGASRSC